MHNRRSFMKLIAVAIATPIDLITEQVTVNKWYYLDRDFVDTCWTIKPGFHPLTIQGSSKHLKDIEITFDGTLCANARKHGVITNVS